MKRKLSGIIAFSLFFISSSVEAQNKQYPCLLGVGTHFIDYSSTDPIFKGLYDLNDFSGLPAVSKLDFGRNLNNSFATSLSLSASGVSKEPGINSRNNFFGDIDLSLRYLFANDYILKINSWFDPYLLGGPGISWYRKKSSFSMNAGVGINFWLSDGAGLYLQTGYNKSSDDAIGDYFQHSIGFVFRFGKGNDADNDGIPDESDKCPDVKGTKVLMGCPDTDGDGIADNDDLCPDRKGPAAMRGCPDVDGDGIPDNMDHCPTLYGSAATHGCPEKEGDEEEFKKSADDCADELGVSQFKGISDSDGDGVTDNIDACPNEKGTIAAKGCPDRDGDGVPDKDDKCPDIKGLAENNGCPAIDEGKKKEVIEKINFAAKSIRFETGKDIIKPISYAKLDTVVSVMKMYGFTNWFIEGHTDNVGKPDKNLDLSRRRASAVKNYFINKGIELTRLSSEGYGDTKPAADNKTAIGRAANRRVEIKLREN